MKLVELVGVHVEADSGTPLLLLRELDAPHRVLPIVVGAGEAASIAVALSGFPSPRPLAHDTMAALVASLDARLDAVEVTEFRDGAFIAELAFSSLQGARRLDSRPSDAIALAVRVGAPVFVSDEVLDEVGTVLDDDDLFDDDDDIDDAPVVLDPQALDAAVAEFHDFLEGLDPSDFDDPAAQA